MLHEEIYQEIEDTLNQLIENASSMKNSNLSKDEIDAFQKTQESLLSNLLNKDALLKEKHKSLKKIKKYNFNEKIKTFVRLNSNFIENTSKNINLIKWNKIINRK